MKITAHIILELDVDERTLAADDAARAAHGLAQAFAWRTGREGLSVCDYSVAVTPCSREALNAALERVVEQIEGEASR